ncbi:hypothetical protein ACFOON_06440, partial [Novosphingobium piscinae]
PPPSPPQPPAPADWRDAAATPGTWRWSADEGRSVARYGVPGAEPVASLSCDAASHAMILWTNRPASEPLPLTVTTTATRRLLTATPLPAGGTAVSLAAGDRLADAIAFSRGRFMVEVAGFPALYLPAWPELGRVAEDCR